MGASEGSEMKPDMMREALPQLFRSQKWPAEWMSGATGEHYM